MYALRMIWKYSRVLRVVDIVFGVFWFVQFARDEFVKPEAAARMRVIDFVPPIPWWVWLSALYVLLLCTVFEAISGWYMAEVSPFIGLPGSLQHKAMSLAAKLLQIVHQYTTANPMPRTQPDSDPGALQALWNWEKGFTTVYRARVNEDLKGLVLQLDEARWPSHETQELTSLAAVTPSKAYAAAKQLQEIAVYLGMEKK